jgi:hypothetical protein
MSSYAKELAAITTLADRLRGDVPTQLGEALNRYDQALRDTYRLEHAFDGDCKALKHKLRALARRILGRRVEIDHLDARMFVAHGTKPETWESWLTLSVHFEHAGEMSIHAPKLEVSWSPVDSAEPFLAQLRALRAASDAYRAAMNDDSGM